MTRNNQLIYLSYGHSTIMVTYGCSSRRICKFLFFYHNLTHLSTWHLHLHLKKIICMRLKLYDRAIEGPYWRDITEMSCCAPSLFAYL